MRVFHAPGSRSLRVLWAVEEMGLSCEAVPTSFQSPSRELLEVNPSRTLPAFVDEDVIITESVAILIYLATKKGPTPLWVEPSEADYPAFLQFVVFGEAGLSAPLNAVIGTRFMGPEGQRHNFTVEIIEEGFLRRLGLLEARLEGREFIAGDRFTIADISTAYALLLGGDFLQMADRFPPRTTAYLERLKQRPAFQRAASR